MSNKFLLKYVFVCDDVRKEDNGKLIVLGVYTSDILVRSFPVNLELALLLAFHTDFEGSLPFDLKVEFEGRLIVSGAGKMNTAQMGDGIVPLPKVRLVGIEKAGHLSFSIKFEGEEWQVAKTIAIVQSDSI